MLGSEPRHLARAGLLSASHPHRPAVTAHRAGAPRHLGFPQKWWNPLGTPTACSEGAQGPHYHHGGSSGCLSGGHNSYGQEAQSEATYWTRVSLYHLSSSAHLPPNILDPTAPSMGSLSSPALLLSDPGVPRAKALGKPKVSMEAHRQHSLGHPHLLT